jgi:hypothetical protein
MATIFLRLLAHDDKPAALAEAVDCLRDGKAGPDVRVVDPELFRQVPGSPFAYRVRRFPSAGSGPVRMESQSGDEACGGLPDVHGHASSGQHQ